MRKHGIVRRAMWAITFLWAGLASYRVQLIVLLAMALADIAAPGVLSGGWFYLVGWAVGTSAGHWLGVQEMVDHYEKR